MHKSTYRRNHYADLSERVQLRLFEKVFSNIDDANFCQEAKINPEEIVLRLLSSEEKDERKKKRKLGVKKRILQHPRNNKKDHLEESVVSNAKTNTDSLIKCKKVRRNNSNNNNPVTQRSQTKKKLIKQHEIDILSKKVPSKLSLPTKRKETSSSSSLFERKDKLPCKCKSQSMPMKRWEQMYVNGIDNKSSSCSLHTLPIHLAVTPLPKKKGKRRKKQQIRNDKSSTKEDRSIKQHHVQDQEDKTREPTLKTKTKESQQHDDRENIRIKNEEENSHRLVKENCICEDINSEEIDFVKKAIKSRKQVNFSDNDITIYKSNKNNTDGDSADMLSLDIDRYLHQLEEKLSRIVL